MYSVSTIQSYLSRVQSLTFQYLPLNAGFFGFIELDDVEFPVFGILWQKFNIRW